MDLYLHLDIKRLAAERERAGANRPPEAGTGDPHGEREPPADHARQEVHRQPPATRTASD